MSRRLRSEIRSCHRCELGDFSDKQRWERVPWTGTGQSGVAVVGEAPGRDEALQGEPFVGRAGKVLDQGLAKAGLDRTNTFILNLICCRPQQNNFDLAESVGAVQACRPWFNAQLDLSQAWLVVLVGKRAYEAVTDQDIALHKVRGKFQYFGGRLWLPTWHPAYVLRQGEGGGVASEYFSDWSAVGEVVTGETIGELPEPKWAPSLSEVANHQLEIHFPGEKIRDKIDRKGWVRIHSELLDDHMLIVDGKKRPKIPEAWKGEPRWTTDELVRIGWGGQLRVSVEDMRRINMAKRVLGARVVTS